ncbi:MAG: hypothetical protein KIH63_002135 [Candidatus Saccharibacteria bacterium]|nr:hypothetical protein [Candidatus Saccharibacteria bacterium]
MVLDNIFERHGYGPDGIKKPDPNLHIVEGELSYIDQLRSLGVDIDPGDELVLANPKAYGPFGDATLNDYEIRRTQQLATQEPTSIISAARQQSA